LRTWGEAGQAVQRYVITTKPNRKIGNQNASRQVSVKLLVRLSPPCAIEEDARAGGLEMWRVHIRTHATSAAELAYTRRDLGSGG
jgi:hypothetical protein